MRELAYGGTETSVFLGSSLADAVARLPASSTRAIRDVLATARRLGVKLLQHACECELARRPFPFTEDHLTLFSRMEAEVQGLDLAAAARHAFTAYPLTAKEVLILSYLARHPGASVQGLQAEYGSGDVGLAIGQLAYGRYGCFRAFMRDGEDQTRVLLRKVRQGASVHHWLQPEVEQVVRQLGLA